MISEIKNNLDKERKILEQILIFEIKKTNAKDNEKIFLSKAINSFLEQFIIINNSTRGMVNSFNIPVSGLAFTSKTSPVYFPEQNITINKEDKQKLLEELKISDEILNKIKQQKKKGAKGKDISEKKTSQFVAFSSKLFLKKASNLAKGEFFSSINKNMKKANMPMLVSTYISTMLFATILVFIIGIFLALFFAFFKVSYASGVPYPIFSLSMKGIFLRLIKNIAFSLILPLVTFMLFYLYPRSQASSIKSKIENELPFAMIHMSAIAGSGVEPVKVFNIIALSSEYPAVSSEIKKLINMINLYGYDLVTALKQTSKTTSSEKLSALLTGIANITISGGDLKEYLEKKASDTLLDYKLQKKSEATAAETSMDLYIGVLIAAPLILMVMLVIMGAVPGLGFKNISTVTLSYLVILGIALLNVGFLAFLKMRKRE